MEGPSTAQASSEGHVDIDRALREFETRCDRADPDQLALLDMMREHTRRLKQARGDWDKPNTRRNWNSVKRPEGKPPATIESFRAYKEQVERDEAWQRLQQQRKGATLALQEAGESDGAAS